MHAHLPKPIQKAAIRHLIFKKLRVVKITGGITFGVDVVIRIARLKGDNVDPHFCRENSLRKVLYDMDTDPPKPENLKCGYTYFRNYIQSPESEEDVLMYDCVFGDYFQ